MYFIETGEDLIGKTIAYINCAQFAEAVVIGTTDGGLMVVKQYDDSEIEVYLAHQAEAHIFQNDRRKYVVDELIKHAVITPNEYQIHLEARRKAQEESRRKEKERHEEYERKEYLRLKAKFEGQG